MFFSRHQKDNVLDTRLQRITKNTLEARDSKAVEAHDGKAFDLISKYALSEARFDKKDASDIHL